MITGKTKSGFEFSISEGFKNDWRFVMAIRDAKSKDENRQIDGMCNMISVIFNDEAQERRFYEHIQKISVDNIVNTQTLWNEMNEIISAVNGEEGKNSQPLP